MKLQTTYEHEDKLLQIVVDYDRCSKCVEDVVKVYELQERNGKFYTCPSDLTESEIEEIVNEIDWLEVYREKINQDLEAA